MDSERCGMKSNPSRTVHGDTGTAVSQSFAIPTTMKAAVAARAGSPDVIHIESVPVPGLKRGHVIIALDYASVGSWDAQQRSGAWGEVKPGTILGADGSGIVVAVATDVKDVRVGERVYSYSYQNADGGFHAEYVSVPAEYVARVPDQLDQRVAGAMPCVAVTAQSGLRALKVSHGEELLVFGASGGVGSLAVWLAANVFGATVTGTARAEAQPYVRTLGAAHVVDPHSKAPQATLARAARDGFAAALLTANGNDLAPFVEHLRVRAPVAYPNGVEPVPHIEDHPSLPFDGAMSREAFALLNKAIGKHTLPLHIEEFPLDRAADAHRRLDQGHVEGKVVLRIRG